MNRLCSARLNRLKPVAQSGIRVVLPGVGRGIEAGAGRQGIPGDGGGRISLSSSRIVVV
jgi:hypothetical protein